MIDLLEELRALIETLSERQVEYALCGGLALGVHGLPRATEDIDLLVRRESVPAAFAAARQRGFDLESSPMRFKGGAVEIHRTVKIARGDSLVLDLLAVTEPIEDVWSSRLCLPWRHGSIWTVSREGLIRLKSLSGRPQDLLDIERLRGLEDASG
jgi:hypothetical protein